MYIERNRQMLELDVPRCISYNLDVKFQISYEDWISFQVRAI
jgi:hypothetical protein